MARIANTKEEYRALFAKTGNQCAFPGCTHHLIDEDNDFVAQVCHIEAASNGGERYNPDMTDEDRKAIDNLIVLCHEHHIKTNYMELYPVDALQKMKADHESLWAERPYQLPDQSIEQIFKEQRKFEQEILRINAAWREEFDLAMELEFSDDPLDHLNNVVISISKIEDLLDQLRGFLDSLPNEITEFLKDAGYDPDKFEKTPYYHNPFHNAFWEMMNIGVPNFMNTFQFHIKSLEVHIAIQKLKEHPTDTSLKTLLNELKSELSEMASTLAHVD